MLLTYLPRDSSTLRAIGGPGLDWSPAEHLLAHLADLTAAANWQRAGDKKARRPQPLPRPGDTRRRALSAAERHRRLVDLRDRTRH